ncbi:MAG TPA: hypothetical protein VEO20_06860 [Thermoplasmata archaeon]|nr:hypothetical protein [Thermoplasmata archaeon]
MQGAIETLLSGIVLRGLSPAFLSVLMAAPMKKVARAQLKKIYVLDERGEMSGEYVLDPDCPVDFNDFLKVLPNEGIGDRDSLFVGEYVFTAFQSGKFVFVLLSRGQLTREDVDWTSLLLTAADTHLAQTVTRPAPARPPEARAEADKGVAEREARLGAREKTLAELEAKLKAEAANLQGRQEELARQKKRLSDLADYTSRMQDGVTKGVSRAVKTLEMAKTISAAARTESTKSDSKAALDARQQFDQEKKAFLAAKADLESKYREAIAKNAQLEKAIQDATATLQRERSESSARAAEEEKTRREIETRVAELSQRFAAMAKERLVASHRPTGEVSEEVKKAVEGEKAELTRERKFLQRRAIELLDREERVRDREGRVDERERELAHDEEELTAREQDLERSKTLLAQARPQAPEVRGEPDEAKKDIDRRVKIIQQKALELLDREEKLRRRAAELEAMEARLAGGVAVE